MNPATETKERPILFSGAMVRAILEGRKTQTRRPIKPQPDWTTRQWESTTVTKAWESGFVDVKCPYGAPGDQLWVRENFAYGTQPKQAFYRVDRLPGHANTLKWRPSIFMPRWASRIMLKITDVRVERLQEISHDDVEAEGASNAVNNENFWPKRWDAIYDKRSFGWETNPWVWVVEFQRLEKS